MNHACTIEKQGKCKSKHFIYKNISKFKEAFA